MLTGCPQQHHCTPPQGITSPAGCQCFLFHLTLVVRAEGQLVVLGWIQASAAILWLWPDTRPSEGAAPHSSEGSMVCVLWNSLWALPMSQFLCLCSPSFLAEVSPCAVMERAHVGEHWGTTCSVLISLSPSARGLESLQPLELGLKALLGSQGFTSDPGRGSFLFGKRAGKHKRSYCPVNNCSCWSWCCQWDLLLQPGPGFGEESSSVIFLCLVFQRVSWLCPQH